MQRQQQQHQQQHQQQQQQRVPRKMVRLYLDNVVPRTIKLFDESTVVKEEKEIVRIYSIDGIFLMDQKGRFIRQRVVDDSLGPANEIYTIGDIAFKVDRSEWQNCDSGDETIQLQPHHVVGKQLVTKYWLRRGAPTALTIVTQSNVVQDFYFLVAAADLQSLREHINVDIATFLSMLMLC